MAFGIVTPCSLVGGCGSPLWTLGSNRPLQNFLNYIHYTGEQRFFPQRKNVWFWPIFGRWIQYVSRISLSPTPVSPGLKAGIFSARTLMYVLTVGVIKNSRIASPRKLVSCFGMMFVPLWHFLAMNIAQISGAFSLIFKSKPEGGSPPQRK